MATHHFLSYSRATAEDLARRLCDGLREGRPSFHAWLDTRELRPGQEWDIQIPDAIAGGESFLFLMTRDSVTDHSVCKKEWSWALKCKKPIVPLRFHDEAELPFRLYSLQYIDFANDFDRGLDKLRKHLIWQPSPEGRLDWFKHLLDVALYDFERERDPFKRARTEDDVAFLKRQFEEQVRIVNDLQAAAARVEANIQTGIDRERQPASRIETGSRFINKLQTTAPSYFQDRTVETRLVADFLRDDAPRLMMVIGRGGTGKTAMVSRLLKSLENGVLPDDLGSLAVDGIVYMSAIGARQINMPNVLADLVKLAPTRTLNELESFFQNPQVSIAAKVGSLTAALPEGRIVLLLDNFEDLLDPVTFEIRDTELNDGLRALLEVPSHPVKVIITSRVVPRSLALIQPGRQRPPLYLDEGLPSPYAENLLRELDAQNKVGLKSAPDSLLAEARARTRGYPRALEALYMILSVDRDASLEEIFSDNAKRLPDNVVQSLVGEAFSRLDLAAQHVVQALAVYGRPVTPTSCDYLLQPFLPGVDSASVLKRLVNWLFVRKEAGHYLLHPEDRAYALSRLPRGTKGESGEAEFSQIVLQRRGADYFQQIRTLSAGWKSISDLEPQLAEFELRQAGEDYDAALWVLLQIGDKLYSWGHYRQLVEMHERIRPAIEIEELKPTALNMLGLAYWKLGQLEEATHVFEDALKISRGLGNRRSESTSLNNLGLTSDERGKHGKALQYYEEALSLANLIDTGMEAALNNVGRSYSDVGETIRGLRFCCQGARASAENHNYDVEAIALNNLGYLLTDLNELDKAIYVYEFANAKADQIGNVQVQHHGRQRLALAYLLKSDVEKARTLAEAAVTYEVPNDHHLKVLLGLIHLTRKDASGAGLLFAEAVKRANAMLEFSSENYEAVEAKALALSGLVVCGTEKPEAAIAAYAAARSIHSDTGTWRRVITFFEFLEKTDEKEALGQIRSSVFNFAIPHPTNYFSAQSFIGYEPKELEHAFVKPPVSPRDEWTPVYFGDSDTPLERTRQFHEILRDDPLIDDLGFDRLVNTEKSSLGDLLIHHSGLLEIVSADGKRRAMFYATQETIARLFAL